MVFKSSSIDATYCIFDFAECIAGGNMALHITDTHILFYHIHTHMDQ